MRWRVQLGINSTSDVRTDVWKFFQNWTSFRGESNLANLQTSRVTSHDYLFIISMTKLDTSHILSPIKAQSFSFNQNLVLLFVFSFSSFVKAKFGAFVQLFVFSSSSSRAISVHVCV